MNFPVKDNTDKADVECHGLCPSANMITTKNTKRPSGYTKEFKQPQRMVTGSARQRM